MSTKLEIWNQALSEMGARVAVDTLSDTTPQARQCQVFYDVVRKQLLRSAPWGFARKTAVLDVLGLFTDDPPAADYPWLVKYAYPDDCLKMRYILPPITFPLGTAPNVSSGTLVPWCAPSRAWRFLPAYGTVPGATDEDPPVPTKVLLANVLDAWGVYTADVEETEFFDSLFEGALVSALASKLIMPLSGNVNLKKGFVALASDAITQARVADGNEAIPSSDHVVDWIAGRAVWNQWTYGSTGFGAGTPGTWYSGYDNAWGM